MLTSAASWKPWVPISTDSHLFRRFLRGRYFLEYWPFSMPFSVYAFRSFAFPCPLFYTCFPVWWFCLVMLIWVDGFLGVVCWGGAIGSRQVGACLMMIVLDCMSMLRARFWLWWFLAGCALCGRLIRSLGCLWSLGNGRFRGLKVMSVLMMAGPVAHDSGIVPSCRVVRGVVPRIAVVSRLNNGRIGRIAVKMRIITVESRSNRGRIGRIAVESRSNRSNRGRIAVELIWLAIRVMRWTDGHRGVRGNLTFR